mmetsp:Transcript_4899/g.7255  ORF Transcript_4899/g.7255 Transcript_4899/m.7255 type:complete len:259 (+) Transcript_4899:19-795(+)
MNKHSILVLVLVGLLMLSAVYCEKIEIENHNEVENQKKKPTTTLAQEIEAIKNNKETTKQPCYSKKTINNFPSHLGWPFDFNSNWMVDFFERPSIFEHMLRHSPFLKSNERLVSHSSKQKGIKDKQYKRFTKTDIFEEDDFYIIKMDVPGVTPEKLHVSLDPFDRNSHQLIIKGSREDSDNNEKSLSKSKKSHKEDPFTGLIVEQRFKGAFETKIELIKPIKDNVEASLSLGVLTLKVYKVEKKEEERKSIHIPIKQN